MQILLERYLKLKTAFICAEVDNTHGKIVKKTKKKTEDSLTETSENGETHMYICTRAINTHACRQKRMKDERLPACQSFLLSFMHWWNEPLMCNRCAIHTQGYLSLLITFQLNSNELGSTPFKLMKWMSCLFCLSKMKEERRKKVLEIKEEGNVSGAHRNATSNNQSEKI